MVVDVVVQKPQKSNVYEYEKKNMYVVTPRCAAAAAVVSAVHSGAPTTDEADERIHAPALHLSLIHI